MTTEDQEARLEVAWYDASSGSELRKSMYPQEAMAFVEKQVEKNGPILHVAHGRRSISLAGITSPKLARATVLGFAKGKCGWPGEYDDV